MTGQPTLITSVQRALHLLDAVGSSERPVTAKALARVTGEKLPTTYHLLRTLVHEGYLCRLDGGYVLGERVSALSARMHPDSLRDRVRPALAGLHQTLHAAAYLVLYRDGELDLVDVVDSPAAPRVDLWVDLTASGHATALGKAVLSALDDEGRLDLSGPARTRRSDPLHPHRPPQPVARPGPHRPGRPVRRCGGRPPGVQPRDRLRRNAGARRPA